ncbi:MAG: GAF domain-containing sensor histidine kinase [Anaerolineae bacterium]|nr:GAF domain-containing sensor histidine kinase [Anaerolineae bacterium]
MTNDQTHIRRQLAALQTVQTIAQELTSELDAKKLLHKILDSAIEVLDATQGSLLLWDEKADELVFVVTQNPDLLNYRMASNKGIAGWVFTNCEPVISGDVTKDNRFNPEVDHDTDFVTQSLLTVPLMNATEKIGVIQVINKLSGEQFDDLDRDILMSLAAQATTSIINARLYQELEADKNRIIAIEDQERKKLARDLHDGPAQTLAAIIMDVDFINKLYQHDPAKVPEELEKLRETAQRTLAQVRNTMFELRPLVLESQGLRAALETYTERLIAIDGLNVHLEVRNLGDERLPSKIEELCFAIIREAVVNIKKHSKAKDTWIIVEKRSKDLIVAVRDNGRGFNVAETQRGYGNRGSLGLLNMSERAELLGAKYSLESTPGRGTLVSLIVPLQPEAGHPRGAQPVAKKPTNQTIEAVGRRKGTGPLLWPSELPPIEPDSQARKKGTGPLIDEK